MHTRSFHRHMIRTMAAFSLLGVLLVPSALVAQEFPREELDEELDELATERAQELNEAYFEYEQAIEDARREAERSERPSIYTERRAELRRELETRVLRIERRYESRRADMLEAHTGGRFEGGEAAQRFGDGARGARPGARRGAPGRADGRPGLDRSRVEQLETELADAWAEFHEAADALRERARTDTDWDGYEAAVTRLENEYQETIADIQHRQRMLRFEMARERRMQDAARGARGKDAEPDR